MRLTTLLLSLALLAASSDGFVVPQWRPSFRRSASSAPLYTASYSNQLDSSKDGDGKVLATMDQNNATAATNATSSTNSAEPAEQKERVQEEPPTNKRSRSENLSYLQSLGAITGRGEFASRLQKTSAETVAKALEAESPIAETARSAKIQGTWELVYCSTQLFRSSPFFMAGRAVCQTDVQAAQFNWFCDMHRQALAISNIRSVRQIVSSNRLVSEFEVSAGAVPFLSDFTPFRYSGGLPITIDGALVSSADITATADDATAWEIYMDTVQIKGSNIPGLRQILDSGIKLESRQLADVLEQTVSSYSTPRPVFRTTYLDDQFRISRDQDDNAFLYVKTSNDTAPTDYSSRDADLGVARLLEGFNDAVTRLYL